MINAALHWYSDTSVLISSQERRKIINVQTEASRCWLLIIFLEKRVLLKMTQKKKPCGDLQDRFFSSHIKQQSQVFGD